MHSAIGSRKDFNNLDEDQLLAEYKVCLEGLLEHEQVLKLDLHTQHCNTSRLQHSINVSYYSFLICYKMGWDYHSAARAGLLHDLYLAGKEIYSFQPFLLASAHCASECTENHKAE